MNETELAQLREDLKLLRYETLTSEQVATLGELLKIEQAKLERSLGTSNLNEASDDSVLGLRSPHNPPKSLPE